jgi:D-alanyl-lipoteichoic acid acyltransferase DltB (MBOAT superfamily)
MVFTSLTFAGFFVVFYVLYLLLRRNLRLQNLLILAASYFFYSVWDWRFLSLILISTLVDFTIGKTLGEISDDTARGRSRRKVLLWTSVGVNLAILGFFKYFNFFYLSLIGLLSIFNLNPTYEVLDIILPLGISFYTLQTLSYTIDIYRKRLEPTRSLLNFAVFVAFFPQLVAGPIERAVRFLPQIEKLRTISAEQVSSGIFLILWGYFKKLVVADNLGAIANHIFNNYGGYQGLDVVIGAFAFSMQIYADFSSYSDIARGLARLQGFELMLNFRLPYFALNPNDFWQRWHISLSSWLRDYIFFPLRRILVRRRSSKLVNIIVPAMATMLISGLWHGAAWHFVIWGGYHGLLLIIYQLLEGRPARPVGSGFVWQYVIASGKIVLMFSLSLVGWVIFRAESFDQILLMLSRISLATSSETAGFWRDFLFFTTPLLIIQIFQYLKSDLLIITKAPIIIRVPIYSFLLIWTVIFGSREIVEFIYFQF